MYWNIRPEHSSSVSGVVCSRGTAFSLISCCDVFKAILAAACQYALVESWALGLWALTNEKNCSTGNSDSRCMPYFQGDQPLSCVSVIKTPLKQHPWRFVMDWDAIAQEPFGKAIWWAFSSLNILKSSRLRKPESPISQRWAGSRSRCKRGARFIATWRFWTSHKLDCHGILPYKMMKMKKFTFPSLLTTLWTIEFCPCLSSLMDTGCGPTKRHKDWNTLNPRHHEVVQASSTQSPWDLHGGQGAVLGRRSWDKKQLLSP